ncbi:MAG: glycosyltransferase [Clostridia bacterium]
MTIDIICPLYHAENYIKNLDTAIKQQEQVNIKTIKYILTKHQEETKNDQTETILKQLQAMYTIVTPEEFSHSLTREKEIYKSQADIVVLITQDIIIQRRDWLYYLTKDIEEGTCDAAYSRQLCNNQSIEKYTRESNYPIESKIVSKKDIETLGLKTFFFSDASSAIKRETFIKLKGYDGKRLPISEDMYIAYKLIMNGYQIKYCAESQVIHSHQFTWKQQYKRYYDTGRFFKENSYLDQYGTNTAGGSMAKYVLNRAWQDKNWKALVNFLPNMAARWIGMKRGKLSK